MATFGKIPIVSKVSSSLSFRCEVCMKSRFKNLKITLNECKHSVCRKCLLLQIQISEELKVKCPYLDRQTNHCSGILQENEIQKAATKEVWKLYLAAKGRQDKNHEPNSQTRLKKRFECKAPDCDGEGVIERNIEAFTCPKCKVVNCVLCQAIHTGMDCEKYWEETDTDYSSNPNNEGDGKKDCEQNTTKSPNSLYPDLGSLNLNHDFVYTPNYSRYETPKNDYSKIDEVDDENQNCMSNRNPFKCSICLLDVNAGKGVLLHTCLHTFCRRCLQMAIRNGQDAEVFCPFVLNGEFCSTKLQDREIREISTEEIYKIYCRRMVFIAQQGAIEETFRCKNTKKVCHGFCFLGRKDNPVTWLCEVCDSENCIRCSAIHQGLTCGQFQQRS